MEDRNESVPGWMKITLVFLICFALFLATVAYLAVFGIPGSYTVMPTAQTANTQGNSSGILLALPPLPPPSAIIDSEPSAIFPSASGTSPNASGTNSFSSTFGVPSVSWKDGGATLSLTGATLQGNRLTFMLTVRIDDSPTCVPLNLRLVADESGDLQGPDTPGFAFPDNGNCNGMAGATYPNQYVAFTVDPQNFPLLFTTNEASSTFFEIATTSENGIMVDLPGTAG